MTPIILEYRGSEQIAAVVDPKTQELKFASRVVTGKMWLIHPGRRFVEIVQRGGRYYLEPAA